MWRVAEAKVNINDSETRTKATWHGESFIPLQVLIYSELSNTFDK